jgi:MFS family permease
MVTTTANAFVLTLPIILNSTLGFSVGMSQCMGAPPYVFSGFLMFGAGWYSDRYKTRGPVLCFLCLVSLIGLPIMGFAKNPWAKYAGVFITVSGTNSAIPSVMAYQANNIRGQWRRAFCSAVSILSIPITNNLLTARLQLGIDRSRWHWRYRWCVGI